MRLAAARNSYRCVFGFQLALPSEPPVTPSGRSPFQTTFASSIHLPVACSRTLLGFAS